MKAAFIVGPRQFEIQEIDMPAIDDDEMLVKLEEIDRAFQDNLNRTPGYIKGVILP